jgi:hypothetical protein
VDRDAPNPSRRLEDGKAELRQRAAAGEIDPDAATAHLLELSRQERAAPRREVHRRRW